MKTRHLFLFAFLAGPAFATPPTKLEQEGKAFRDRMWQSYRQKEAANALRIQEMTPECLEAGLVGRPIAQVQGLLQAAGQGFDMIRHTGPTARPNELVGGFTLAKSFSYSAVFNIVLRTKGDHVDAVVLCNVLMRSF